MENQTQSNEALALVLTKTIEELIPAMIEFNETEIIERIKDKVEFYKSAKYTEDSVKQAKDDKAALNKFVKALNDERIKIGKMYCAPYDAFKTKVDRIIGYANEATDNISEQLDTFEQARIAARREFCKGYWHDLWYNLTDDELAEKIPYERVEDKKWLNASTTEKKAAELIYAVYEGIKSDLQTIEQLANEDTDALTLYYYTTLSLSATLRENERRKAESRKIAEMRAKREADEQERKAKEETERRAFLEAQAAREAEELRNAPEAGEVPAEFIPPAPAEETQTAEQEEPAPAPAPKLMTVRFEVTATLEQMKALKAFFIENNIKIKSI
jgi:hypothetical protein